jgi:hypothetical protein
MPQPSTLLYVSNLVIQKILANADPATNLGEELERAYPLDDSQEARRIWRDCLRRHAILPFDSGKRTVSYTA